MGAIGARSASLRWSCWIRSLRKIQLTLPEPAPRWLMYHKLLGGENDDVALMSTSSTVRLESILMELEKGLLLDAVVRALDRG